MKTSGQKYKIAVFTKPLDNWTSGSGHHLDRLLNEVLVQNKGEFDFTFVHYAKSENPIYSNVKELIVPRNPFKVARILDKQKFDLVHFSPLTVYAPWWVHAKKTATVHGVEEELYPEGYSWIERVHCTYILPFLMRRMDGIATVSNTSKNWFVQKYKVNSERIFITTNGLSSEYRILSKEEIKAFEAAGKGVANPDCETTRKVVHESLAAQVSDKPFVLHISRYSMRKNPECILKGFAEFIKSTKLDYNLILAGKDWDSKEVFDLAQSLDVANRIITPGFISTEDAVYLLNKAEVFIFPSFAEGFGMPNIEAMACACPVVTSNIFAIPEVVGDAAEIISDPRDYQSLASKIALIVTNTEHKKNLVERGLERAKTYNWVDSATALLAGWRAAIGQC